MEPGPTPFLTAEWRHLVMLNYEIDPVILQSFVPAGTELDHWQGRTFVSMVGFLFLNTKVCGLSIPFHSNFEEVNLRFYVRRNAGGEWRRGVVFIKELVPRPAIAWVARTVYNENYESVPMKHEVQLTGEPKRVAYGWKYGGLDNQLAVTVAGEPKEVPVGSDEEFITEHYWGYARQRDGGTVEYKVEHPRWHVWSAESSLFECDVERLYGREFAPFLEKSPASAFLADGSPVTVFKGAKLTL